MTKESRHAATDPDKCFEMERKYGWELLRWERNSKEYQEVDPVFKVDCIFEGETNFPNYLEDLENE